MACPPNSSWSSRRSCCSRLSPSLRALRRDRQSAGPNDKIGDLGHALVLLEIGEKERARPAHLAGVAIHHVEARPHQRCQIDLVDHEEIGARDPRPSLARNLVAGGDVDHIDREIREFRTERRRKIVAAGLDEDEVEIGKAPSHLGHRGEIDRGVLADRRMRTTAGLDADDPLGHQRAGAREELRILLGIDVVGDDGDVVARAHMLAEAIDERGLAGADGTTDADAKWAMERAGHERKSLVYCVSCLIEHQSSSGAAVPTSSSGVARAASAAPATSPSSRAITHCPSLWPSGINRNPAETRLPAKAWRYAVSTASSGTPWAEDTTPTATGKTTSPR